MNVQTPPSGSSADPPDPDLPTGEETGRGTDAGGANRGKAGPGGSDSKGPDSKSPAPKDAGPKDPDPHDAAPAATAPEPASSAGGAPEDENAGLTGPDARDSAPEGADAPTEGPAATPAPTAPPLAPGGGPARAAAVPLPWRLAAGAALAVALAFAAWGVWRSVGGTGSTVTAPVEAPANARQLRAEIEQLQQRVTTLNRSDQITREANRDLQGTLAERDEEIAGLRADVAFYERLVGATAQRRGLSVHALRVQPQEGAAGAWHFTSTLTQNLNRGAVSAGRLTLAIEGTRGGRLQKLVWGELRQQPEAPGVPYSFKYFQQVQGDLFLPAGLTPVRVTVRLTPDAGAAVEQSFTWADASREGSGTAAD